MINKIIIATGIYLQENNSCTPQNIQDFTIKHFDEIRIPLKEIEDWLNILVLAGFVEKFDSEKYRLKNQEIKPVVEKDKFPLFQERKLWSIEL